MVSGVVLSIIFPEAFSVFFFVCLRLSVARVLLLLRVSMITIYKTVTLSLTNPVDCSGVKVFLSRAMAQRGGEEGRALMRKLHSN